ncbi:unnamed protein product [Boreogadus saida]
MFPRSYVPRFVVVLVTLYWLGRAANSCVWYSGPALDLTQFSGLLAQMRQEEVSPKASSIRDSGYIDCWDSERSDSLSPPRHAREDSFDSLDSLGSRSRHTPSPDVLAPLGSSDGMWSARRPENRPLSGEPLSVPLWRTSGEPLPLSGEPLENLWRTSPPLWRTSGEPLENLSLSLSGEPLENLSPSLENLSPSLENLSLSLSGEPLENLSPSLGNLWRTSLCPSLENLWRTSPPLWRTSLCPSLENLWRTSPPLWGTSGEPLSVPLWRTSGEPLPLSGEPLENLSPSLGNLWRTSPPL